ncbi:MAG: LysE family transporter [Actinobacteria bacterium]|nr:LysE family transporter [Actinomycetota bacterium]
MSWLGHVPTAFGLGFALGAAPGPVQVLILSETSRGGLSRGLRVMLGANGTLLAVMLVLALGFSAFVPGKEALGALRLVGGAFLIYLGAVELRSLRARDEGSDEGSDPPRRGRAFGPTTKGILSVALSPGAWVFFATTAAAVVAQATTEAGRGAAVASGLAMAAGVSSSDFTFALLGSGGRGLLGERGLRALRIVLAAGLVGIGVWFAWQVAAG